MKIRHIFQDANTFAEWGVDYIKIDGCYVDIHEMDEGKTILQGVVDSGGNNALSRLPAFRPVPERHRPPHRVLLLLAGVLGRHQA